MDVWKEFGIGKRAIPCLMYFIKNKEGLEYDIEKKTKLRQPEVSVGVNELIKRGYVKIKDKIKLKKGRPRHVYALAVEPEKIIQDLEKIAEKRKKEIDKALENIKKQIEKMEKKK